MNNNQTNFLKQQQQQQKVYVNSSIILPQTVGLNQQIIIQQPPQPQTIAPIVPSTTASNTTDALIINSNSTVVNDEIILQLQEQFGDGKQIYILNTSNNSVSSSSSYSNPATNTTPIQYLIVDKDVDINAILQDPSIFNHTNNQQINPPANTSSNTAVSNPSTNTTKKQTIVSNPASQTNNQQSSQLIIEESIQRVQEPPPKRKQFEFKLENKRMSYQDAFLRFLAGEKQPSLDLIYDSSRAGESASKKPAQQKTNLVVVPQTNTAQTVPPSIQSAATASSTVSAPAPLNDKENYYNSSRRENLLPLNNYEYRNSYKDHYDNQGVRLNPAILKNLTTASPSTSAPASTNSTPTTSNGTNGTTSSITITPKRTPTQTSPPKSVLITKSDHTYKQIKTKDTEDVIHIEAPIVIEDEPEEEEVTFEPGEFLIHKSTFSCDFDNYDIWCVLDEQYLQKYEPVLLSTGERCHQSADVLAQYTQDKNEFILVKCEEKGKTEQNNIVVGVLNDYEPKNRKSFMKLLNTQKSSNDVVQNVENNNSNVVTSATNNPSSNVVVVTYDDLKGTFDVFLQVLLSQYLNTEFLLRIKEIQDEYFKPSLEFIDSIINDKYNLLYNYFIQYVDYLNGKMGYLDGTMVKSRVELKENFKYLLDSKPKMISLAKSGSLIGFDQAFNYYNSDLKQLSVVDERKCLLLDGSYVSVRFSGALYNIETLLCQNNGAGDMDSEEFLLTNRTFQIVNLLHSLRHFKMGFYEICSQKIESIRLQLKSSEQNDNKTSSLGSSSNNTELLNYCLADSMWLFEMFEKFKQLLIDVDNLQSIEHSSADLKKI